MHALYTSDELDRARAREKRATAAMIVTAGLGLAACVILCCFATKQNRGLTLPLTIGASTLFGWIVIFLSHSRRGPARAQVLHLERMLTGPRETFTGRFEKLEGVYRVKRGVSIRKVRQQEEFHEAMLTVADEKAARLPDAFTGSVETVYDCIVAWMEVPEEARALEEVLP